MKHSQTILTILLSAITAWAVVHWTGGGAAPVAKTETAYERVLRTGVLRCGYASWDPMLIVDPATKKITGIAAETIEAAASYLNLKVAWVAEYGWSDFLAGLETRQVDVFCPGPTPNAPRARVGLYTEPFLYGRFPVFARADDHRFDNNVAALDQPTTKFSTIDGTTSAKIIGTQFPKATFDALPETVTISQVFQDLADGKADATLQAASMGALYMKNNPGKIREVSGFETVRVLPHVFIVRHDEIELKEMLDAALQELRFTGAIEKIVRKYDAGKRSYLFAALAYNQSLQ